MKTRSYLRHILVFSLLCLTTLSQAAKIIFRPGPGLNDGTDTGTLDAQKSITNLSTTGSYTKSGTTTSRLMVIQTLKFY